jgi:hypothetical protein
VPNGTTPPDLIRALAMITMGAHLTDAEWIALERRERDYLTALGSLNPWTTVTLADIASAGVNDPASWNGNTLRFRIAAALMVKGFTQGRLKFRAGSTEGLELANVYAGLKGAGPYDFAAAPVPVLFGGLPNFSLAVSTDILSDPFPLVGNRTDAIVVSAFCNSSVDQFRRSVSAGANYDAGFIAGDDAATIAGVGYTTIGDFNFLRKLELFS